MPASESFRREVHGPFQPPCRLTQRPRCAFLLRAAGPAPTRLTSSIRLDWHSTSPAASGAPGLSASRHYTHWPCAPSVRNGFFTGAAGSPGSQAARLPGTALAGGPCRTHRTDRRTAALPKYHRWGSTWHHTQDKSLPRSRKICRIGRAPGPPREWRAAYSTMDKPGPCRRAPARHYRRDRPGRQRWGNVSPALHRQSKSRQALRGWRDQHGVS